MSGRVAIAIAGAGFAGLGMAIQLKRHGIEDFVILERAAEAGGTWRDNVYPGCACDIPSMLYSFSFAPSREWTRTFPRQPEIRDYLRACIERYGLRRHLRLGCGLDEAAYDAARGRWRLTLADGSALESRVLIAAPGALNRPYVPGLPGLERFVGPVFHSSQWDHGAELRDRAVAVIGTGASAIQFVPEIAPLARTLTIFQRSAPWVIPRPDAAVSPLRRTLRRRFPGYAWVERKLVYWLLEVRALGFTVMPALLAAQERAALAHMHRQVRDPELRRKLTPDYRMGCKRVLISSDYYPALTRANVALVTEPIAEVREHAVVTAGGVEHRADAIVLGTGFRATDGPALRIVGRDGRSLAQAWRDGMSAYLGTSVAGFPNLFVLVGPNTGLGHNSMVLMMEAQYRYVLSALALLRRRKLRAIDVKPSVQRRFNARLQRRMGKTVWASGCSSWYIDRRSGTNTTLWPGFTFVYRRLTRRVQPRRYELIPER